MTMGVKIKLGPVRVSFLYGLSRLDIPTVTDLKNELLNHQVVNRIPGGRSYSWGGILL